MQKVNLILRTSKDKIYVYKTKFDGSRNLLTGLDASDHETFSLTKKLSNATI